MKKIAKTEVEYIYVEVCSTGIVTVLRYGGRGVHSIHGNSFMALVLFY